MTPDQRRAARQLRRVYTESTAADAQRILNRVAQVFVEENSRSRELRAQDTSEFITLQLRASEERLTALEGRLRTAKEAYMGRLPSQTGANLRWSTGCSVRSNRTPRKFAGSRTGCRSLTGRSRRWSADRRGPINGGTALSTPGAHPDAARRARRSPAELHRKAPRGRAPEGRARHGRKDRGGRARAASQGPRASAAGQSRIPPARQRSQYGTDAHRRAPAAAAGRRRRHRPVPRAASKRRRASNRRCCR